MLMPRVAAPQEQDRLAARCIRLLRGGVSQPSPGVVTRFPVHGFAVEFLLARHSASKLGSALTRSSFQRTVTVGNMRDTAQVITTNVVKAERKAKLV